MSKKFVGKHTKGYGRTQEGLNKWRDKTYSQKGKVNIAKMSYSPNYV